MFSVKASVFKQLPYLLCIVGITSTCVDRSENTEIEFAQAVPSVRENIVFPPNASVIDVTAHPYGARPNDGKDDTKAIQKALSQFPNQGRIIYLPNGVYDISDTLHWPRGVRFKSDYKRTILQGQSRDGVIIRLKDNSPGFQNPTKPRPVISTGFDPKLDPNSEDIKASRVAQRFGNSVRNLTIKLGKKNYGAEGLNFAAHNQGAVRSVKIISEDRSGTTGLALTHGEVGPLLIEDVEIIGFDYGIRTNTCINSITMQDITVRDQNRAGILNGGQVISLEGFTSFNSVRAIINGNNPHKGCDPGSTLTLVNANLIGHGKAKDIP
ncbi:MAG: glycoside hydrolase family 55 protein, partial [Fischerella sp.]|nr:glycoside hydrolase family 55 protein [Fischerella sp.]